MPIGIADFVKQHDSLKYLTYLGLLVGVAIPINLFGVEFRLGNIFFIPIALIISGISCFAGFCINITFELFYILMWIILLVVFVGWNK